MIRYRYTHKLAKQSANHYKKSPSYKSSISREKSAHSAILGASKNGSASTAGKITVRSFVIFMYADPFPRKCVDKGHCAHRRGAEFPSGRPLTSHRTRLPNRASTRSNKIGNPIPVLLPASSPAMSVHPWMLHTRSRTSSHNVLVISYLSWKGRVLAEALALTTRPSPKRPRLPLVPRISLPHRGTQPSQPAAASPTTLDPEVSRIGTTQRPRIDKVGSLPGKTCHPGAEPIYFRDLAALVINEEDDFYLAMDILNAAWKK